MKKTTLSTLFFSSFFALSLTTVKAQKTNKVTTKPLITSQQGPKKIKALKQKMLTQKTSLESVLKVIKSKQEDRFTTTSEHISSISQIRHQYIRQAINGLEVIGTESSIHNDKNGKLIKANLGFINNIESLIKSNTANLTPEQAISMTAQKMGYGNTQNLHKTEKEKKAFVTTTNYQKLTSYYTKAGISSELIPLKKLYYFDGKKSIMLAYEFSIQDKNSSDWYNFTVDANNGNILNKFNLTHSCNITGNHEDHNHSKENKNNIVGAPVMYPQPITQTSNFVGGGSYNVYPMPIESPGHGNRSIVNDPADANASPYGWHDVNGATGAEYTYTRGNNTIAYDDDNGTNGASTQADYAEGGASLDFNFTLNTTYSAANQSEDAAVTNTFFWANIIHDVVYQYGFDEASGNFQENNYGNGGAGGDSVNSEIQDGSGTCNANFGTPTDGANPRMQMYTCNARDGDYDNVVIVHEYTHGISTRLTGGAGNSGCLQNAEQIGEGWGDFLGLMMTIEPGDLGTDQRGIGTWLTGAGPNGAGIRPQPYSTTNTQSYADVGTAVVPHGVGSIGSAILWKLNWALIDIHGFDADIYNGTGGNNICLALVMEGMKLQPCNPGFVDVRDAILAADTAMNGGANNDTIWQVFADSGLGENADQGSTNSNTDGTTDNTVPAPSTPTISFATPTSTIIEGSDCGFTDVTIPVNIGVESTQSVVANFTINGSGTATNNQDFTLSNNSITFTQGATAPQDLVVRVYNDAFIEGNETITLNFTINNNGGDASTGNTTHTLTITDDDLDPLTSGDYPIFEDDFENGLAQWTVSGAGSATNFAITNNASFPNSGFFASDDSNTTNYAFVNDDNCNCTMTDERMESPTLNLTANVEYTITFDYVFDNQYANDIARIELSNDGGANWFGADLPSTLVTGNGSVIPFTTAGFTYTPTANESTTFALDYNDATGWGQGLIIDNFKISTAGPIGVETIVSGTNRDTFPLEITGIASAYDSASNDIILTIESVSNFDYGCVTSSITRSGNGTQSYNGSTGNNLVSDKSFNIKVVNQATSENTTVDFYFTETELTGLLTGTGLTNTELFAHREGSNDIVALTPSTFGDNTKFTGNFTGLDGTYYIGAEGAFKTRISPKVFLSGPSISGGLMNDALRANNYLPEISPYTDNLTVDTSIFNTTGADAIVDWVWIELRDATDNTIINASRSALLQRDGDVVDLDGVSAVTIITPSKDFFIAINHRNHLGAMTLNPIALSATPTIVDFTSTSLTTNGTNAQRDMGSGVLGLWAGDSSGNGQVRFLGPGNDLNNLKSYILSDSGNTTGSSSFPVNGYSNADINLNGQARFLGPGNDNNILKSIILANPANTAGSTSYPLSQQIP